MEEVPRVGRDGAVEGISQEGRTAGGENGAQKKFRRWLLRRRPVTEVVIRRNRGDSNSAETDCKRISEKKSKKFPEVILPCLASLSRGKTGRKTWTDDLFGTEHAK